MVLHHNPGPQFVLHQLQHPPVPVSHDAAGHEQPEGPVGRFRRNGSQPVIHLLVIGEKLFGGKIIKGLHQLQEAASGQRRIRAFAQLRNADQQLAHPVVQPDLAGELLLRNGIAGKLLQIVPEIDQLVPVIVPGGPAVLVLRQGVKRGGGEEFAYGLAGHPDAVAGIKGVQLVDGIVQRIIAFEGAQHAFGKIAEYTLGNLLACSHLFRIPGLEQPEVGHIRSAEQLQRGVGAEIAHFFARVPAAD
ncbi:hypothetical protein D3C75_841250 [compost metagenome]